MIRYTDFEELKERLGYKTYKPKIGNLGKAIIKYSKEGNHRSINWLKSQLDELYKQQKKKNNKGQNEHKK